MVKVQDRLYIDEMDRELYEMIEKSSQLFVGKSRKEQFLFALTIGFNCKTIIPLKKREGFFLRKDLKIEDEALINSVAINHAGKVEILSEKNEVYKIAEEYAHAGIRLLVDKINSVEFGTFWKHFEKDLLEKSF